MLVVNVAGQIRRGQSVKNTSILGTFLGSMVLAVLQNGMNILRVGAYWQDIIIGAVLILSVSIDAVKGGSLKRKL